jgi:hypothetical protein
MDALTLRPRSASEIADASINLMKSNAKLVFAVAATLYVPIIVVNVLFMPPSTSTSGGDTLVRVILALVGILWGGLVEGAVTVAVSERYLGRDTSAGAAISAAFSRGFRLAFGVWARWMLIGFGLVLLIVPGIYAFIFSFAMTPAIILEKRGINAAWLRSRELARGMKSHVLGSMFIAYLVFFAVLITVGFMAGGLLFGGNERAFQVLQGAISILVWPFVVTTQTLLYYDLRIRKEGFDIEHLAGATAPVTAGAR